MSSAEIPTPQLEKKYEEISADVAARQKALDEANADLEQVKKVIALNHDKQDVLEESEHTLPPVEPMTPFNENKVFAGLNTSTR
jgi:hypothetical protein